MTLSLFWSRGEIIKAYRKLKTIIKKKMWGKVSHIFLSLWPELEKADWWPNVPAETMWTWHTMQVWSNFPIFLPWASVGIVFMLWILSGKCWALCGICKEIWFPTRGCLMTHVPACLATTLGTLGEAWTLHRYGEITENVPMFSKNY